MKNDLTTGAWQHDIGCPISIVLFSTPDAGSPWASNEGLYEPPKNHKAKVPILHNKSRKQYSVADAWAKGNIAKYHWKLSGRRSAD